MGLSNPASLGQKNQIKTTENANPSEEKP
jgi:hypothetical protein